MRDRDDLDEIGYNINGFEKSVTLYIVDESLSFGFNQNWYHIVANKDVEIKDGY